MPGRLQSLEVPVPLFHLCVVYANATEHFNPVIHVYLSFHVLVLFAVGFFRVVNPTAADAKL